jgi:hypothetical protein
MKHKSLFLGLVFLSIDPALAQDDAKTQELIKEGQKHFTAGDCKKAYPPLKEAYLRSYKPNLLTSIAQCAEFLQDNFEALGAYCAYQILEPNSPYKTTIEKNVNALRKKTGSDCPMTSDYLPPTNKEPDSKPDDKPPAVKPAKGLPTFVPIGLGVVGAGFGAAAMLNSRSAKSDGTLETGERARGLLLAGASDAFFVGAGVTLFFSLRKPEAQTSQVKTPGVSFAVQIPLP